MQDILTVKSSLHAPLQVLDALGVLGGCQGTSSGGRRRRPSKSSGMVRATHVLGLDDVLLRLAG